MLFQDSQNQAFQSLAPNTEMMSLLEHSDRSIIILDTDYRILWFNLKASREMYAFFKERLKTGASYWDYVDPEGNKRFIRNFQTALKGRKISTEQRITKPTGKKNDLWIEGRFSPLVGKAEEITGVIYSYVNISDRKRAEVEEQEKTHVIQAIEHNDSQGFILIDEDNRILNCNLLAPAMLATVSNNPSGLNVIECIHPYWKEQFEGGIKVARAGGTVAIEFDKPAPKNEKIEIRFAPVKDRLSKQNMVSIWSTDITDRVRAERKVKLSEENLRAVFNSSSQTFYLLDNQLNILAFNQPAFDLVKEQFGWDLEIGMNIDKITAKENLVQFRVETDRAFSGRKVQVQKHFFLNNKEFWFERHLNPVFNKDGSVDRITLSSVDITDRKKAEKALKENESKFRKLASLLPVGIYQVDKHGNTTYINECLQLIIGTDMTSVLDGSWSKKIHTKDKKRVRQAWRSMVNKKQAFNLEYRFTNNDGQTIHVLEQAQPLFNHLGEYLGYLGTVVDVTEQQQTQQLVQEKHVAEKSLEFRSDFLASMSHEIRTPLNGIMAMSEILLDTKLSLDQKSKLQNVLSASHDLREIVNDVLNLSELESGKVVMQKEIFSVSELLETIIERYKPEAEVKSLTLSLHPLKEDVTLNSDRRRLTQVLSNLVRNAIKFTQKGGVGVRVIAQGGQVLFQITDTGLGVPKKDIEKLFKDFSQLEHTTAQNLEGTGLGLSISKRLIQLLGGTIGVKSTFGKGSVFWFEVPIGSTKESVISSERPKRYKQPTANAVNGTKVLLVEDNLINQQAFKVMLTKMGCVVDVLSNGKQAVDNFGKSIYDIVFMDIQMPIMDGLTATTEIKKRFEKTPPIVGLSGNILQRDEDGNLKSDMDDLLLKPVVSNDIERMIQKWVT
ncbi:MAG: PAS domain S-box-containing protein [Psychroserpens sp.]|jgi:PAS domain S-box-containing protein